MRTGTCCYAALVFSMALLVQGCGDGGGEGGNGTAAPPASSGAPPGGGTAGGGAAGGSSGGAASGSSGVAGGSSGGAASGSSGGAAGGSSGGVAGGSSGGSKSGSTGAPTGGSTDGAGAGSTGGSTGSSTGSTSGASAGAADGSASTNRAPTIAGTPQAMVLHDYRYRFVPAGADADGDALTFAIEGLPAWASFDPATGRVSGTPTAADVGNYTNIRISVSDGKATAALAPFAIAVVATAPGSAELSWLPPTANTDGSALTNLAGYRVYWGDAPGNYDKSAAIGSAGIASHVVAPLTPGTWYFVVTAVNADGIESAFSNMASKTIQ